MPGFILQGGGFTSSSSTFTSTSQFSTIPTTGTVPTEANASNPNNPHINTTGTIAMALSTGPNSGTDEWFINLANNPQLDDTSDGGPFTVFGQVIDTGMQTVNQIASLPIPSNLASPFNSLPVGSNNQLALISSIVVDGVSGTVYSAPAGDTNVADRHPLTGVTVFNDANNDGILDNGEVSATTDASGHYFLNSESGTVHVRVQTPAGFQPVTPGSGESDVTLTNASPTTTQDFGFQSAFNLLTATGTVNTADFTNQNNSSGHTLTFQIGGTTNGALVKVFDGQTLIGQATATSSTVDVTTDGTTLLADGPHTITASQVVAGTTTTLSTLGITVDTAPPVFSSTAPSGQTEAGSLFAYTAHATDANSVTYSLVTAPAGMTINGQSGLVSWTPNASQSGNQSADVRATDLAGNTADQTFTIVVHDTPPVLTPIANVTTDESKTVQFTVQATDINLPADTLFYTLGGGAPAGAAINGTTGTFVWAPNHSVPLGTYQFQVIVTDAAGKSDAQQFTVTELPTLAQIATQTARPGETLSLNVQASGDDNQAAGQFTFSLDPGAPAGASIDANGHFTWTVPSTAPLGSVFQITVRVTSNGTPPLSAVEQFSVDLANPADLLFTIQPFDNSGASIGPALQALTLAGQTQRAVMNVLLPFDYFQQASTPYGLSGVFTETGLPHAYEDEELLAGQKVTANKPTGEAPDGNQPGDAQPVNPMPNGPSNKPADGDDEDQGAWWGPQGELRRRVERQGEPDDDEVLAMNAIAEHILGLFAPNRAAIDEALADDETIDPYEALVDDSVVDGGVAVNGGTRKEATGDVQSVAAMSVLLPFTAQPVHRRRPTRPVHWQRRLERLRRC